MHPVGVAQSGIAHVGGMRDTATFVDRSNSVTGLASRMASAISGSTGLAKGSGLYRVDIPHALGNPWRKCELGESVYLGEVRLVQSTNGVGVA
jgi:hypothetical protein